VSFKSEVQSKSNGSIPKAMN